MNQNQNIVQKNYRSLRVSIWDFNHPDKKVEDHFIPITDELRQMTMIQFHDKLNERYIRSDKQLILFQGREIKVDKNTVAHVLDLELVTIKVQGVQKQISPMKLPLHVFEEKQVANLSKQNQQFYQNKMNEINLQRIKQINLNVEKVNIKMQQPKLCFVIDTTQSMYNYRKTILEIVDQTRFNQNNPDFSLVLYKDVGQQKGGKYVGINFPNRLLNIKQIINDTCYDGGDDEPDDLNGALEQALSYSWVKEKKEINQQIVVITDSPCHGKQYHNLYDDYPNKDLIQVIEQIKELKIRLTIYTFNDSTDQMINQIRIHFSMHSDYFKHIDANKMYEQTKIEFQITQAQSTVIKPLQSNLYSSKILDQLYQKLVLENELSKIDSLTNDVMVGIKQIYYLKYNTIDELLKAYDQRQEILNVSQDHQIKMNVSFKFINNGNDNIYLIRSNDPEFKNKIFFTKTKQFRLNLQEALIILTVQSIAKEMLQEFKNKQPIVKEFPIPEVNFSELILIKLENTQQYIICEEFYPHPYTEFNTQNQDQITLKNGDKSLINQFLQHFTHESLGLCDNNRTMVINLVGFSSQQKTILTDPHLLTLRHNQTEIEIYEESFEELNLERFYSIFE